MQLKERLEAEQTRRTLYTEGKDELIYDLEQRLATIVDELAGERTTKDTIREQIASLSREVEHYKMELVSEQSAHEILRKSFEELKQNTPKELEQLRQNLNTQLERERKTWSSIATEKETLIENLQKRYEVGI